MPSYSWFCRLQHRGVLTSGRTCSRRIVDSVICNIVACWLPDGPVCRHIVDYVFWDILLSFVACWLPDGLNSVVVDCVVWDTHFFFYASWRVDFWTDRIPSYSWLCRLRHFIELLGVLASWRTEPSISCDVIMTVQLELRVTIHIITVHISSSYLIMSVIIIIV